MPGVFELPQDHESRNSVVKQTRLQEENLLFTGHELQLLEHGGDVDREEEDRVTHAEKNEWINQQLKVHWSVILSVCTMFTYEQHFMREDTLQLQAEGLKHK